MNLSPMDPVSVRRALLLLPADSPVEVRRDCAEWLLCHLGEASRDIWLWWATTWEPPDAPGAVALWEAHAAALRIAARAIDNARKRRPPVP